MGTLLGTSHCDAQTRHPQVWLTTELEQMDDLNSTWRASIDSMLHFHTFWSIFISFSLFGQGYIFIFSSECLAPSVLCVDKIVDAILAFSEPVIVAYLLTNLCYGLLFRNYLFHLLYSPTDALFHITRMLIYLLIYLGGFCELHQINLKCVFFFLLSLCAFCVIWEKCLLSTLNMLATNVAQIE